MESITSKDNRTLKHVLSLKQRKNRNKHKEYLVEGFRGVHDLVLRNRVRTILVKASLVDTEEVQALLALDKPIIAFAVADELFASVEDTVTGQGIIGIAKQMNGDLGAFKGEAGLYILLDGVQDPGNAGTIIRTAVAAGAKAIFFTKGCVDVYNEKTVRSAVSAMSEIDIYTHLDDQAVAWLVKEAGLTSYVTTLEDARDYSQVTYQEASLLVLGNEGNGVRPEIQALCHNRIHIPLYGPIESLNVGIAAALAMYKVREQWTKA